MSMAATSGVRARITKKGIEYANAKVHNSLSNELRALNIPDLDGKGHHYKWHIKSIENRGFTVPQSSMSFVPDQNALNWTWAGLSLKLKGDWNVKYRKDFIKFSAGGSVSVEIKGATVRMNIKLGVDDNGRPSISLATCDVDINDKDIEFHGEKAFIYNLFRDVCGKEIEDALKTQICKAMEKLVNEDGARKLGILKVSVPINNSFTMDTSLTQTPSVRANYLETELKGKVYWREDTMEAPIPPSPIAPFDDDSKMLYIWLSDYSANTFMLAGQEKKYFNCSVISEKLPITHRNLFATSSQGICIGTLIPEVRKKYPDSQVEAEVASSSVPIVKTTTESIMVDHKYFVKLFAHTVNHNKQCFLDFNMDMSLSLKPCIVSEKVSFKIVNHSVEVKIGKSCVGDVTKCVINSILDIPMTHFAIPAIQKTLDKGFKLPVSNEVKFQNPEIKLLDGSLVIATDVEVL